MSLQSTIHDAGICFQRPVSIGESYNPVRRMCVKLNTQMRKQIYMSHSNFSFLRCFASFHILLSALDFSIVYGVLTKEGNGIAFGLLLLHA